MNTVKKSMTGFMCTIPFLFFACKKNSDAAPSVPDANEQQIFFRQKVNKQVFNNTITLDTFRYQYNPTGQLTYMTRSLTGDRTEFLYSGDTIKKMNIYDNTGKLVRSYSNYLTISDNGNTIMLDHSPEPSDTVRYYYYFKKNVIQSYKTYFHYAGNSPLEVVYNYRYDANENLKEIEVLEGSNKHLTSVLTVGGKNPFYKMIKTNFIYQASPTSEFAFGKMLPVTT